MNRGTTMILLACLVASAAMAEELEFVRTEERATMPGNRPRKVKKTLIIPEWEPYGPARNMLHTWQDRPLFSDPALRDESKRPMSGWFRDLEILHDCGLDGFGSLSYEGVHLDQLRLLGKYPHPDGHTQMTCLSGYATFDAAKRPTPDWLRGAVAYQLVLRTMTRDGTFRAATEMLDHVRSAGVDIVYVTPFVEMDCDADRAGWSPRQIAAGWDSPKNPYRISDYDRIDPEYGGDDDFRDFNARAHALGMKVVMDLVYLHCGPNNVLKDRFPDAFQRNPDGTVKTTRWNFPYVNFASKAVRRYLIDSMLHWMRLGCDGFRCDVGDEVPIDFWQEAMATCRAVNPDLVMINEGVKPEWLEKVFDACYAWPFVNAVRWRLLPPKPEDASLAPLSAAMAEVRRYEAELPDDALMFVYLDNHDTANDDGEKRFDRVNGAEAGNAAFVATFLRRGLPLIFNGNEIADNALSSFFAPVGHPGRAHKTVDWARAQQPAGRERLALIRRLAALRHDDRIFSEGTMEFVPDGEETNVLAFVRRLGDREVLVAANLSGQDVSFDLKSCRVPEGRTLLGRLARFEGTTCRMGPWGYLVKEAALKVFLEEEKTQ